MCIKVKKLTELVREKERRAEVNSCQNTIAPMSMTYRIYSCISRPFTTKKSAQKIALDLYASHTQRLDQTVRGISITTA